jgi:hypothetical protein
MKFNGKRLLSEEFREQSTWIGKLLQPINDFTQQLTQLFDNKITLQDNLSFQIHELDITIQASNNYPVFIKPKFNIKPVGLWVGNVFEISGNPSVLTNPVFVDWNLEGSQIRINNITGLTTSKRYKLSVFISYG